MYANIGKINGWFTVKIAYQHSVSFPHELKSQADQQTEIMMKILRFSCLALLIGTLAPLLWGLSSNARAATPDDLNRDADSALHMITSTNPVAADVAKKAKAVLVFPTIVKAGLIFGGAYGEGELKEGGKLDGYYNSITASWGLQAGAQSYGYAVFLMTDKAVKYIHETHGLEIGVGPTVVVVNEGVAKNLSTSTLKDDAYAFIFDQQGLMLGISLEGTKISRIHEP
jgi:lipid-binding SYLF domain-containing protein